MENNPEKKNSPEEEAPAQRLRRILSSSQTQKTDVEPLSSQSQEQPKETSDRNAERPEASVPYEEEYSKEPLSEEFRTSDTQPIEIERVERKARASGKVSPAEVFQDAGRNISAFFQQIFSRRAAGTASAGERHGGGGKPPIFNKGGGNASGCLLRGALIALFSLIILGIIGSSIFLIQYFVIASDLPNVDDLRQHASQFQTTSIYDRNGNLIYEILDPSAGRRTYTTLDHISPYLIAATIATEDKDFYTNPGFDPMGIVRALWQNYTSGKVVSGASTITQQLARALLLSPEERNQVTTHRKAREIVLAAEITRRYSKDDILEMYLNEVYYGNLAYGVEAAAETYFGTSADQLNLAQASFLAGLPQAPAVYDIFTNRDATLARQTDVLGLMVQLSEERKCIKVNNSSQPVCVAVNDAVSAAQQTAVYTFVQRGVNMPYPHWVNYIRTQLEARYDPQTIYRSGFKVYTTLDPRLQDYAQASIKNQVAALVNNNATDGALVAIEPSSGQILAMVGSADFNNDAIAGQVNMAVALRQPGSSIKPLTYTAAFEKGWTPATLIWDVPSEFPPSGNADDTRDPYQPVNYDGKFHGPVLARDALANSYNIPAVKTLSYVGIYDDPTTPQKDGFIAFAERMGIDTFTRNDYGLSLTLGGGDVTLLELTSAYGVFANAGTRVAPYSIERIEDHNGNVVYQHENTDSQQVISADHAYLISSILSDNAARTPAFGASSVLKLPFTAAVKTGTTNDFRDNWTLGYTPDIVVGVWIGNADYTPMTNISGVAGAAPVWADVMQWAIDQYKGGEPTHFKRPDTVEDDVICSATGAEPSDNCKDEKTEVFAQGQPPLKSDKDIWQDVEIDTWTNLKASSACSEFTEEKKTINVTDQWARKWLTEDEDGKAWAKNMGFSDPIVFTPDKECDADSPRPTIVFVGLKDGDEITDPELDIYAVVSATADFKQFKLQYGVGDNPSKWKNIVKSSQQYTQPTKLATWDVYEPDDSRVTLRIYMESTKGTYAEKRIHLNLEPPEREEDDYWPPDESNVEGTPTPDDNGGSEPIILPTIGAIEDGMDTPQP